MGSIVVENRKSLMLFSGRGFPELAEEIGQVLGVAPTPADAYEFANGEIFVRFKDSVRGSDAFVVQSMTAGVKIGKASRRERGEDWGGAEDVKKKETLVCSTLELA